MEDAESCELKTDTSFDLEDLDTVSTVVTVLKIFFKKSKISPNFVVNRLGLPHSGFSLSHVLAVPVNFDVVR